MTQPSGWYDDPQNPENLRYWDGVTWTAHTTPKKSPTADQSTIGLPQDVPPAAAHPAPAPTHGYPYDRYPTAPQMADRTAWMGGPTTADGVPLASWGRRVLAWFIDGVILTVLMTVIMVPFMGPVADKWRVFLKKYESGGTPSSAEINQLVTDTLPDLWPLIAISAVTIFVYCVAFWMWRGQTPGKMATGISVRLASKPGPLTLSTAAMRRVVPLAGMIPSVGGIITLLDYLWPLWDPKRQALHDKVAGTQVVVGKQPPRQR